MRTLKSRGIGALLCLGLIALAAGCSSGPKDGQPMKGDWFISLDIDGQQVKYPVKVMNVMLVEDIKQWPESYEIIGEGIELVGEFPMAVHVGYEAEWSRTFGKEIQISPKYDDYALEVKESSITIPGKVTSVVGGTIRPARFSGKWAGRDGDYTLHGDIELEVEIYGAETRRETLTGTFSIHCVTWG